MSRTDLTPREMEVLGLSITGLTDSAIASVLGIRRQSVKNTRALAYRRLGAAGPHALLDAAHILGWITPTPHIYAGEGLALCGAEVTPCPRCIAQVAG